MDEKILHTDFAPAERIAVDKLNQEVILLTSLPKLEQLLDSIPDIVLILNEQRQIVFANQAIVDIFKLSNRELIYGLRPGEVLRCEHSHETDGGCGTTAFCKTCGAVNAIISGLRGNKKSEECRISQMDTGLAFDLRVTSTPFRTNNMSFVIFVATDISNEKRRNVLERTFFHDIKNTLSGITGFTDLLSLTTADSSGKRKLLERLSNLVKQLGDEIESQRGLMSAENGDLFISPENIHSIALINDIMSNYKSGAFKDYSGVHIDGNSNDITFISDKALIYRALSNMLKNALEASNPDDKISIGCFLDAKSNSINFWVQNPQFIPPDIAHQIFNRSFSTKGKGRGIGTYSMKLLTEKYLNGKISFTTSEQGTTFSATLPLILDVSEISK